MVLIIIKISPYKKYMFDSLLYVNQLTNPVLKRPLVLFIKQAMQSDPAHFIEVYPFNFYMNVVKAFCHWISCNIVNSLYLVIS